MKKVMLLTVVMLLSGIIFIAEAQTVGADPKAGETIFIEHVDKCLDIMEQEAQKISITGVAVIAFIPGDRTMSWISKMKVVGVLATDKDNFLGIANAKASEMGVMSKVAAKIKELGMFTFVRWNWIFVAPPLNVNKIEIDEGLDIISQTIAIADKYCN